MDLSKENIFSLDITWEEVQILLSRDKTKEHVKVCDGFSIITFWMKEIPKVAQAGWAHRIEEHK